MHLSVHQSVFIKIVDDQIQNITFLSTIFTHHYSNKDHHSQLYSDAWQVLIYQQHVFLATYSGPNQCLLALRRLDSLPQNLEGTLSLVTKP